tara:strand:+ start:2554 stop:3801 length:1248 start_codon:yes stop_codon:yes gene_type:complete
MFLYLYRFLINLVLIISPLIIILRLLKKKEDFFRFKEKFNFFSKKKIKGKLVWFHGASVGEVLSVIPLIEKLEKDRKIKQILVTSSTVSSSKVFKKFKFKKTSHQFFPIDTNFISKNFLNYWKPSLAIFIDSEIWPNMLINLKKKSIPVVLLNGRITLKSFRRWKLFGNFSKKIFQCFSKALVCNKETLQYLKYFNLKNIKYIGNLKFSEKEKQKVSIPKKISSFLSKKNYWCAGSTHHGEEIYCIKTHKEIKKEYKNLVTIIIPRHINRKQEIISILKRNNLNFHCHSWNKNISNETDIYLVDTYGETSIFYKLCKIVFMGGSLIKHGGQNPLEASRLGCKILHGPNINNFKDIYKLLQKLKISQKINTNNNLTKSIKENIKIKASPISIIKRIEEMGIKIKQSALKELKQLIN